MLIDMVGLLSKIKSMEFSGTKSTKIPRFLMTGWIAAVLLVWLVSSFAHMTVAEIPWSVLILLAILLGSNIGINLGGAESIASQAQTPATINYNKTANQITSSHIDPVLSSQTPIGEKD